MTPAELITRKMIGRVETAGATVPLFSLLIEAINGERHEAKSSAIALNVHISEQLAEPLPMYSFSVSAILTVSIDDDKSGLLFRENYDALWSVFDWLARGDNCSELGDENDDTATHVFAVDGFQLGAGSEPDYQTDDNGGAWTVSFTATVTGRANLHQERE